MLLFQCVTFCCVVLRHLVEIEVLRFCSSRSKQALRSPGMSAAQENV